ncbi:alkene reductase [Novosphingobium sp. KN65.2]|uniref:alkene reductase n=1 Tax=Novosphingobium sp. KN65.2 TaxID=1478134 RepID=UPI0006D59849|nr:alkene reductase [Novosphingobium sp. KN65.2]
MRSIFSPITLGSLDLSNRVVMSPMTRDRAGSGDAPGPIMIEYYRQRAGAGLIVTEGTQPCPEGKGYWRTPGIHSDAQIDGWRKVADAVHAEGGRIVMQLMHVGRVVVPENRGFEAEIVAPSALPCPDRVPGPDGVPVECAMPRALDAEELPGVAAQFAQAARNAREAGIDGVELHCSSGYLINQFLNANSNRRDDAYGGDALRRARFPTMVVEALAAAIGADRVGVRISPGNAYNGMTDPDPAATFAPFLDAIDPLHCAYLHVVDMKLETLDTLSFVRGHFSGPVIANNMLTLDTGCELLESGRAEAISFGRPFIANPDFVERLRTNAPLAKPDYARLYTGEERGYIDYPALTD